jgi:hypothetical protein
MEEQSRRRMARFPAQTDAAVANAGIRAHDFNVALS